MFIGSLPVSSRLEENPSREKRTKLRHGSLLPAALSLIQH